MTEKSDKLYTSFHKVFSILLPFLFAAGLVSGGVYANLSGAANWNIRNNLMLSGLFQSDSSGFLSVFSGFLFDYIFIFLIVFLFGMTFLGIAVIPLAVLYKGITQGIALVVFLAQNGNYAYIQRWIAYMPAAALATMVVLSFSVRAGTLSLRFCRALFMHDSAAIPMRSYTMQFAVILLTFTAIALFRCVLGSLAAILF